MSPYAAAFVVLSARGKARVDAPHMPPPFAAFAIADY